MAMRPSVLAIKVSTNVNPERARRREDEADGLGFMPAGQLANT
jgi:hypothetical protein